METSEHEDGRRRRRSYDEAFKRDAVRLVAEEKYSFKAAATAVIVSEQSLRAWHAKFAPAPDALRRARLSGRTAFRSRPASPATQTGGAGT